MKVKGGIAQTLIGAARKKFRKTVILRGRSNFFLKIDKGFCKARR